MFSDLVADWKDACDESSVSMCASTLDSPSNDCCSDSEGLNREEIGRMAISLPADGCANLVPAGPSSTSLKQGIFLKLKGQI